MGAINSHHGLLLAGGAAGGSTAYYDAVMADHPAFYLRLNETSLSTAADSSGNGINGFSAVDFSTLTSTGLLSSNSDRGILTPGAAGSYAGIRVTTTAVPANADWTVELLVLPTGTPPAAGAVGFIAGVHSNSSPGYPEISLIETVAGSKFRIRVMRGSNSEIFRSTTEYSYGTKLHIVFRYTAGTVSLRINNVADGSAANTYGSFTGDHYIGYDKFNGGYPFKGYIDEVAYYATSLSDTRVAAHYAAI